MRKLAFLLITLFSISIYAQKAELKSAQKLYKKGNLVEALKEVNAACQLKDQADDKTKAKIMYTKAEILAKLGSKDFSNYEKAIAVINKLQDFEKKTGKERYSDDAKKLARQIEAELGTMAPKLYEKKEYEKAAKAFELIYKLNGNKDLQYYAAVAYLQAKDWDKALPLLQDLYKTGYTGQKTVYTAVNKSTGKEEQFADKKAAKLMIVAGTHKDLKETQTKNLQSDIITNILYVLGQKGDEEAAIKFIEDAEKVDPNNLDIIIGKANYYLKKQDSKKFAEAMQKAVNLEPNNKIFNFNLATAYYQMGKYDEAKKYYEKTVELDPGYVDAYKGLAYIVLVPEKEITEQMNKDEVLMNDRLYNKYRQQQLDLYKKALPYFEKAREKAPEDQEVLSALNKIYRDLGYKDKAKEVKAKLDEVRSK